MALIPTRQVAARYNVTLRSIDRWIRDPELGFPKPIQINTRNYFDEVELDDFDRQRALARNNKVSGIA
ncbi:DNA-binding protein [Bradyrhizobium sp. CB82]|uniref:helix-turn-helix transcriptional regulator n=1 Tax=Bradyrhizobium sp. CB82 TaxID=3039159 RepID=UPI0024B25E6A|nr:DNA-binding protein [Bradyrhizobium sp. CB82]WFU44200.1 DNA-binding protein [Bradyrhizobium sp. CB82]